MKRALLCAALALLVFLSGYAAGFLHTVHTAVPVGVSLSVNGESKYIVSYRYFGYWRNEAYPLPTAETHVK